MNVNVGDTVRFLNSVGGGRVQKIEGQIAYVDEDGFETPVLLRECVVVTSGNTFYEKKEFKNPAASAPQPQQKIQQVAYVPDPEPEPFEETPEGEKLNVVIAFEPSNIKRLSEASFDAFVVNDSNYYLMLNVATRSNDSEEWTLRYGGIVEPAMQIFLFELLHDNLPEIDRLSVQITAFKRNKDFTLKAPIAYEQRLDATKFARLHCFASNPYFDTDVLAIDIVKDDVPQGRKAQQIDPAELERAINEKKHVDRRQPQQAVKRTGRRAETSLLEIDLHATELLDSTAGLSKADILNYQIDTFRKVMNGNLRNIGQQIVFIHGKGEGVLRAALLKELNHKYKGHDVSDASFREYGFGATKVTIRNVK